MADNRNSSNLIINRLTSSDFARLQPELEPVDLPLRKVLEPRLKRIDAVYFMEDGFASVVSNGKMPIEVGVIGREGVTGISALLGIDRPPNETFIQAAGRGQCIKMRTLREATKESATLQALLLRYVHAFLQQTAKTAIANGRSRIEQRLARWLLMADDRIAAAELPLTHEFLAMMLGVRRPGVTIAIQQLERDGLIARRRGTIVILDRDGLEKLAGSIYDGADFKWP